MKRKLLFGELIKEFRVKKNMTQSQLAESLGYESPQFISLLERDKSRVPLETLGMLIVILDLPEEKIISGLLEEYTSYIKDEIHRSKKMVNSKD